MHVPDLVEGQYPPSHMDRKIYNVMTEANVNSWELSIFSYYSGSKFRGSRFKVDGLVKSPNNM